MDEYGSRVIWINQKNSGLATTRNNGIAMATGEFILPLDADDWIDRKFLEKTVPLMADPKVGVVSTYMQYEGLDNNIIPTNVMTRDIEKRRNGIPVCSLVRLQAFQETPGYVNGLFGYEDWNFWIDILKRGWKHAVVKEPLFHYLRRSNSMCSTFKGKEDKLIEIMHSLHPELYSNPRISYVIPAYNCEKTIEDSVMSIIKGNWVDGDELIMVDDGSTDGTLEILNKLASQFSGIQVFRHAKNLGGGAARNTAVEHANYRAIFLLDSDNLLEPNSVHPLADAMFQTEAGAATFERVDFFKTLPTITHHWTIKSCLTLADYFKTNETLGSLGCYMFTKDAWVKAGGFPEDSGALDSWGFGLRLAATGSKILAQPGSSYLHRYGIESYWIRQSKEGNTNDLALKNLVPFFHLLAPGEMEYVTTNKNWMGNLQNRPLRVKEGNTPIVESSRQAASLISQKGINQPSIPEKQIISVPQKQTGIPPAPEKPSVRAWKNMMRKGLK
jgi:glycosyltransferase involved in cell wall biosynthesis